MSGIGAKPDVAKMMPCRRLPIPDIEPMPPVDFAYDVERDICLCPNGKPLRASGLRATFGRRNDRFWHFSDTAGVRRDFLYGRDSGHAADRTGRAALTRLGSRVRIAAVKAMLICGKPSAVVLTDPESSGELQPVNAKRPLHLFSDCEQF
jgi:hypothetical protein